MLLATNLGRWHADIKPDNILQVQNRFKLADPGFAKIVKAVEPDQRTKIVGGTRTFGECNVITSSSHVKLLIQGVKGHRNAAATRSQCPKRSMSGPLVVYSQ